MEISKRILRLEHPFILTNMANLALIYRNKDWWDEAEELEVQAIKTYKKDT